jgi:uncharacterized protein
MSAFMITASDLPEMIPIFPLPGALMLPRGRLPLHIFEPRYLAMVEDCMKTKTRLIGMIQPRETPNGQDRLQSIGCAGRLSGFSETEDGRYMITLSGISRFRVKQETEGFTPYRRCLVNWAPFARDLSREEEIDAGFERDGFFKLLGRYFEAMDLSTDWEGLKGAETELLINSLSMLCPFSGEDKQALLEAPSLSNRRETLVTLIEFAMRGGQGEEPLQ